MMAPGVVDAQGNALSDPTENVRELFEAGMKRQDDLRAAESRHVRETAGLRAEYASELREAETQRINAIRQVDVEAVQRTAEVQATQQSVLASQVVTSAEALRTQVAAAAQAAQIALAAALEPIIKDIADLRRAQYEAQGVKAQTGEARGGVSVGIAAAAVVVSLLAVVVVVVIAALGR